MRAIWTGAIGFGLVNIPVRIYSAIESSTLDLDMLDKRNHANIKYQRINESTGKVVPWEDIIKGYKYEDTYIEVTDEDFEKASPEKSKVININEFVLEANIDTMYFDTPYYLEPAKGGEKAYALLHKALEDTGKVGLGSFVMRTKENLCLLKAAPGGMITLVKLRFAEDIREAEDLKIPAATTVKPAELKMAISLINQLTEKKFDITKYKDTYNDELLKLIHAKAKGKKIAQPKFKMVKNNTTDIMSQLKESLKSKKAG
jgi:DNA end-binding protein Ku